MHIVYLFIYLEPHILPLEFHRTKSGHQFLFMGNRSLLKYRFALLWFYINILKSLVYILLSIWYSFLILSFMSKYTYTWRLLWLEKHAFQQKDHQVL